MLYSSSFTQNGKMMLRDVKATYSIAYSTLFFPHGDQTRRQENFYMVDHTPALVKNFCD